MNMKKTAILFCMMLAVAGCSSDQERIDYKSGATKGRPLDMPPDLVLPKTDGRYVVPAGGTETSATYSEYARSGALQGQTCVCQNAAAPLPASAVAAAPLPRPVLQTRPGNREVIVLAESFDRCWLRVSQAMDAAAISAEDKDRSKGLFYLQGHNQLSVQGTAAGASQAPRCEVSAGDGKGGFTADSRRITEALYKALGQQ
jgi:uncharacterized lipoprotein